jgi:mannonate dehydratase
MEQTWRWFGPEDPVPLAHVRQAGATGIVSALHSHYRGEIWPEEAIAERKRVIEAAGLTWSVVESIPVPDAIKVRDADAAGAIANFRGTMERLAGAGLQVICYNFMPVVDWTRTALRWPVPSGGLALRFDMLDFVTYDALVLKRPGAESQYPAAVLAAAENRARTLTPAAIEEIEFTVIAGLPGSEASHDREGIRGRIARYEGLGADGLRANLIAFLKEIIPTAERLGLRMCIHPDDPPMSLFGLPRVVGGLADYQALADAVPEMSNGVTFCTGSLGASAGNDVEAAARALAPRIHFAHLRNVTVEADGSFFEDDHLAGRVDMVSVVGTLLAEEARRREEGRTDAVIPFRPDHGHLLLDDQEKKTYPGYSAIGRLKGLAELRGIITALGRAA